MGTAPGLPQHDELLSTLIDAIEIGYRHFDIAAAYGSEEALGRAVVKAIQRGLIKSREQVFITSKLWCTETHRDLVLPALKRTLGWLHIRRRETTMLLCNGIHIRRREQPCCYPLGANGIPLWGNHAVMQSPLLKDIAIHHHESIAQVKNNNIPVKSHKVGSGEDRLFSKDPIITVLLKVQITRLHIIWKFPIKAMHQLRHDKADNNNPQLYCRATSSARVKW